MIRNNISSLQNLFRCYKVVRKQSFIVSPQKIKQGNQEPVSLWEAEIQEVEGAEGRSSLEPEVSVIEEWKSL